MGWFARRKGKASPAPRRSPRPHVAPKQAPPGAAPAEPVEPWSGEEPPLPPVDESVHEFVSARLDRMRGMAVNALDEQMLELLSATVAEGELEIPLVPDIASELLALDADADLDNSEVATLIGRDAALAAKVLQVASSPLMGGHSVEGMEQCVSLLGFEMVRCIAVAVVTAEGIYRVPGYEDEAAELRRHAEVMAETCGMLARRTRLATPSELFLAGLFHDVGQLVVYLNLSRLRSRTRGGRPTTLLTRKLVGELHPVFGLSFAEARSLPESLRWPIGYHHAPALAPQREQTPVALVGFAELLMEDPDALESLEEGDHPALLDPAFWGEDLPDAYELCKIWRETREE
ncbi:MAG: HDOD domain-containing protein [Myxococcota bacterium]|nr:HDOD domain-containing protein [Myxococcota bacterium]